MHSSRCVEGEASGLSEIPCPRCDEKRGGYQFRWFSPCWAKFYNIGRREGSWKAPIGDDEAATTASLRFWGEVGSEEESA